MIVLYLSIHNQQLQSENIVSHMAKMYNSKNIIFCKKKAPISLLITEINTYIFWLHTVHSKTILILNVTKSKYKLNEQTVVAITDTHMYMVNSLLMSQSLDYAW